MSADSDLLSAFGSHHHARVIGNVIWLLRLRWVAIAGQLITIAVVTGLWQVELNALPLYAVVAITAGTNVVLQWWLREKRMAHVRLSEEQGTAVMALTMTLDLALLTALLYFSGGPRNPFSLFYFVNLALAAILLPSRWSWGLTFLAILCFSGFYLVGYLPINELEISAAPFELSSAEIMRRQGMIAAFAACAIVNCYFIGRVSRELERRETDLRSLEQKRAQSARLEALATLAAGAGHELASPLSTIAVIAGDLNKHLEGANVPASVIEDVALIRSELAHCRSILDRMSGNAGEVAGEQMGAWTLGQIVDEVVQGLRRADRVQVQGLEQLGTERLQIPLQAVAQAIRGLVQNGIDAAPPHTLVTITVAAEKDGYAFRVRDEGSGMPADVLARAGEPFFTTKEPGQGMGLGLFLTRNVIERLGGTLQLSSQPNVGTTAEVHLPRRHVHA
jgi:two-component system, sensor histidine kinase RegB